MFLTELHVKGRDTYWKVRQAVEATKDGLYTFDQFKSVKPETRRPLRKLVFNVPTRRELNLGEKAITHGLAIASGVKASKDLATCHQTSQTQRTLLLKHVALLTITRQ